MASLSVRLALYTEDKMSFINTIRLILSLLPLIVEAVNTVEKMFPQGGLGQQKLEFVRNLLEGAFKTATDVSVEFEKIWPPIQGLIGSLVTMYNSTKVFQKGDPQN